MEPERSLTADDVNQRQLRVRYAVRGPVLQRALQLERELAQGVKKPFASVVRGNLADCHALGQPPLTFLRQVVALAALPALLAAPGFPEDARRRARRILDSCAERSVGAYSPAAGLAPVRADVAAFLSERDGVPADADDVYFGSGASDLIKTVLAMFVQNVNGKPPAVMIPIPQYPLFSGTLTELGLRQVDCFLDEERDWELSREEMERSLREASVDCHVRALIIINPGNPTGHVLTRENMEEIVRFAYDHRLFLLADEVYQENIISKPFHSFKKVMHEMGAPYSQMELASFLTVSKGLAAECGLRVGLVELVRASAGAVTAFRNARGLMQCSSVLGQCALDCVVRPPAPGDESYERHVAERRHILRVMEERAAAAHRAFSDIPGYSCIPTDGPMFAYPRIEIPESAQRAAREQGLLPDELYCLQLLEETGVCATPGSGFGQRAGTFHFRLTFPFAREPFDAALAAVRRFHLNFLQRYA
ncbi:alanine aminotransferase 1-like [Battus philenor]|uniref:alanine aminotransferase 1-like n=1 Tax=Battus philenor TaxID=42288 RepID=UPI0035CFB3C2